MQNIDVISVSSVKEIKQTDKLEKLKNKEADFDKTVKEEVDKLEQVEPKEENEETEIRIDREVLESEYETGEQKEGEQNTNQKELEDETNVVVFATKTEDSAMIKKEQANDKVTDVKVGFGANNAEAMEKIKEIKENKEINLLQKINKAVTDKNGQNKNEKIGLQSDEITIKREFGNIKSIDITNKEMKLAGMNVEKTLESNEKTNKMTDIDLEMENDGDLDNMNKMERMDKMKLEAKGLKERIVTELGELMGNKTEIKVKNKEVAVEIQTETFGKVKVVAKVHENVLKVEILADGKIDHQVKKEIIDAITETSKNKNVEVEVEINDEQESDKEREKELEKEKKKKRETVKDEEFEKMMEGEKKND